MEHLKVILGLVRVQFYTHVPRQTFSYMMKPTQRIKTPWTHKGDVAFPTLLVRLGYWLQYGCGNSSSEYSARPW